MDLPRIAFKEWAAIVLALERGIQDIVLRRGGIAEERDAFEACHDRFLLFPTYFHQQRVGIRPEHRELYGDALAAEPPAGIARIGSYAEVLDVRLVGQADELLPFATRHVYEDWVLDERRRARRGTALHLLEVRVHRLPQPIEVALGVEQSGCKSWVPIAG